MTSVFRTRFLAENYSALHGLNAVPVGLCLFLVSLWANLVHYPIKSYAFPVALGLACLLLAVAVAQYYRRSFGELKPVPAARRLSWVVQAMAGVLGLVAFVVDVVFHLPVSLIGLLFAAMFMFDKPAVTFPLNRFTLVRFITSICILLVSIAPVFLGRDWWDILGVRSAIVGVTMFVGALIAIQGVIWHIFFVNSLPAREAQDG